MHRPREGREQFSALRDHHVSQIGVTTFVKGHDNEETRRITVPPPYGLTVNHGHGYVNSGTKSPNGRLGGEIEISAGLERNDVAGSRRSVVFAKVAIKLTIWSVGVGVLYAILRVLGYAPFPS